MEQEIRHVDFIIISIAMEQEMGHLDFIVIAMEQEIRHVGFIVILLWSRRSDMLTSSSSRRSDMLTSSSSRRSDMLTSLSYRYGAGDQTCWLHCHIAMEQEIRHVDFVILLWSRRWGILAEHGMSF